MEKPSSDPKKHTSAKTVPAAENAKASDSSNAVENDGVFEPETEKVEKDPVERRELQLIGELLNKSDRSEDEESQLEELLEKNRVEVAGAITRVTRTSQSFQGPLPPPSILEGYEHIVPGTAARIVDWADSERIHRHTVEKKAVFATAHSERIGQIIGGVVALSGFGLAGYALHEGADFAAAVIAALDIGSITTAFVYGNRRNREE